MFTVPEPWLQPTGYRHSPCLAGVDDPKELIRRVKVFERQLGIRFSIHCTDTRGPRASLGPSS